MSTYIYNQANRFAILVCHLLEYKNLAMEFHHCIVLLYACKLVIKHIIQNKELTNLTKYIK